MNSIPLKIKIGLEFNFFLFNQRHILDPLTVFVTFRLHFAESLRFLPFGSPNSLYIFSYKPFVRLTLLLVKNVLAWLISGYTLLNPICSLAPWIVEQFLHIAIIPISMFALNLDREFEMGFTGTNWLLVIFYLMHTLTYPSFWLKPESFFRLG